MTTGASNQSFFIYSEYVKDPKYKTEMCKNWEKSSYCPYGVKCRFAHGKEELMAKENESDPNYKSKDCLSFFKYGSCNFGRRCCFRHDERKFNEEHLISDVQIMLRFINPITEIQPKRRLNVFEEISQVESPAIEYKKQQRNSASSFRTISTRHSSSSLYSTKKKIKFNKRISNEEEMFYQY